jgi:hypothetical protein
MIPRGIRNAQRWPRAFPAPGRAAVSEAEPTWEEAIVALAAKVRQRYGDDRAQATGFQAFP